MRYRVTKARFHNCWLAFMYLDEGMIYGKQFKTWDEAIEWVFN